MKTSALLGGYTDRYESWPATQVLFFTFIVGLSCTGSNKSCSAHIHVPLN